MRRLLEEATGALARLDLEALEEMERRAAGLRALLGAGMRIPAGPELAARHRVFAAVVKATGDNLAVLERASGSANEPDCWAREANPWVR